MTESCYFILHILLKYYYQYEYKTYESCAACEGEDALLRQLNELNQFLKGTPKFSILLDGINEILMEIQEQLQTEIEWICNEWENISVIVTGRTVPNCNLFSRFTNAEVCGITEQERNSILSQLENSGNDRINTRGELLDEYVTKWESKRTADNKLMNFIVQYALPFAAKTMTYRHRFEIDRAFKIYLINERIYQNFTAPENYRKNPCSKAGKV